VVFRDLRQGIAEIFEEADCFDERQVEAESTYRQLYLVRKRARAAKRRALKPVEPRRIATKAERRAAKKRRLLAITVANKQARRPIVIPPLAPVVFCRWCREAMQTEVQLGLHCYWRHRNDR
jgi:hypothetical protein